MSVDEPTPPTAPTSSSPASAARRRWWPWLIVVVLTAVAVGSCLAAEPWKAPGAPAAARRLAGDPVMSLRPPGTEPSAMDVEVLDRFVLDDGPGNELAHVMRYLDLTGDTGPVLDQLDRAIAAQGAWTPTERICSRSMGTSAFSYERLVAGDDSPPVTLDRVTVQVVGWPDRPRVLVSMSALAETDPSPAAAADQLDDDLGCLDERSG